MFRSVQLPIEKEYDDSPDQAILLFYRLVVFLCVRVRLSRREMLDSAQLSTDAKSLTGPESTTSF